MNNFPKLSLTLLAAVIALAACGKKEEPAAPAAAVESAAAQACGKVTVANMNWQSAEVLPTLTSSS